MATFTFRKHEHLCRKILIQEVFTTGKAVHDAPLKLIGKALVLPAKVPAQVAFSVPKRNLKKAVQRNRIKRLMREAYRKHKPTYYERIANVGEQYAWLFVFNGKATATLAEIEIKMVRSLDRWLKEHG